MRYSMLLTLVVVVVLSGCSKADDQKKPNPAPALPAAPPTAEPNPPGPIDAAPLPAIPAGPTGTIAGTVSYQGEAPTRKPVERSSDPYCAKTKLLDESLIVGEGGALANALVRLSPTAFRGPAPSEPVVITQDKCMYRPRVVGAVEGQSIEVRNADDTIHNVHGYDVRSADETRALYNEAQLAGGKPIIKPTSGKKQVKLTCDIHPWMRGFVVVTPHPFFAVTDAKGAFEIPEVPAGSYTVEAWHEVLGTITADVTVSAGEDARPALVFSR